MSVTGCSIDSTKVPENWGVVRSGWLALHVTYLVETASSDIDASKKPKIAVEDRSVWDADRCVDRAINAKS